MGAQDLYKVLGVSSDATQEQVEKAYKQRQSAKVGSTYKHRYYSGIGLAQLSSSGTREVGQIQWQLPCWVQHSTKRGSTSQKRTQEP